MKLTTLDDGSRDGQLAVVSRDLASAHFAAGIAGRMQALLDDWNFVSPQLEDLYARLNDGKARHAFAFDPTRCRAPLPRAYQWLSATDADAAGTGPLSWVQLPGDALPGPHQLLPVNAPAEATTGDSQADPPGAGPATVAAGLAAVTADLAPGLAPEAGLDAVRLLLLFSEADGTDRRATAFAPVAVTPDELGLAWHGGRVALNATAHIGRRHLPQQPLAEAMRRHLGEWVADAAATRRLGAGSVVGCRVLRWDLGAAEREAAAGTGLQMELVDAEAASVFGTIEWQLPAAL